MNNDDNLAAPRLMVTSGEAWSVSRRTCISSLEGRVKRDGIREATKLQGLGRSGGKLLELRFGPWWPKGAPQSMAADPCALILDLVVQS